MFKRIAKLFAAALAIVTIAGAGVAMDAAEAYAADTFTVKYYSDLDAKASDKTTTVTYGTSTALLKPSELKFSKEGYQFDGWKLCQEGDLYDDKGTFNKHKVEWKVKDSNGKATWMVLENGEDSSLPEGYTFDIYPEAGTVAKTVAAGFTLNCYATWRKDVESDYYFYINYKADDDATASGKVTKVKYGELTKTLTAAELEFSKEDYAFTGWKMHQVDNDTWKAVDSKGNEDWKSLSNGSLPSGWDYQIYVDGVEVSKTVTAGKTLEMIATWTKVSMNVTDELFGANGSDKKSDADAINTALRLATKTDQAITVTIPKGTYYIDTPLYIFSNTTLKVDKDATIIRTDDSDNSKFMIVNGSDANGGYDDLVNVTIQGGTWDGNPTLKDGKGQKALNLFYLYHGSNLTIKDLTLKNVAGDHHIELVGIKDSTISNVTIDKYYDAKGQATEAREAIQLDYASKSTSSGAGKMDNTVCKNITIENVTATNVVSAIGNHHAEKQLDGLVIKNCSFTNTSGDALNIDNMINVEITDCTFNNVSRVINIWDGSTVTMKDCKMKKVTRTDSSAITVTDASTFTITGCTLEDVGCTGIRINMKSTGTISNNTLKNIGANGMDAFYESTVTMTDNYIDGTKGPGIYIQGATLTVTGNTVLNAQPSNENGGAITIQDMPKTSETKAIASTGTVTGNTSVLRHIWIDSKGVTGKNNMELIKKGWNQCNGKWYYMYADYSLAKGGWIKINKTWYMFEDNGAMKTGWLKDGGKWYYLDTKAGTMVTGWKQISKKWYYFNKGGDMVTGWKKISGKWYYFNKGGDMVTGWKKLSGTWYYFNKGGDMKTGWLKSGGKWYYFDANGAMVSGKSLTIDGKKYTFNADGSMK